MSSDVPTDVRTQVLRRGRRPDLFALTVGIVSVTVAIIAFVGRVPPVAIDPRWLLAVAAIALGVLLLGSSLRRRR